MPTIPTTKTIGEGKARLTLRSDRVADLRESVMVAPRALGLGALPTSKPYTPTPSPQGAGLTLSAASHSLHVNRATDTGLPPVKRRGAFDSCEQDVRCQAGSSALCRARSVAGGSLINPEFGAGGLVATRYFSDPSPASPETVGRGFSPAPEECEVHHVLVDTRNGQREPVQQSRPSELKGQDDGMNKETPRAAVKADTRGLRVCNWAYTQHGDRGKNSASPMSPRAAVLASPRENSNLVGHRQSGHAPFHRVAQRIERPVSTAPVGGSIPPAMFTSDAIPAHRKTTALWSGGAASFGGFNESENN